MPAPFLIAPMLISMTLMGAPATEMQVPREPQPPAGIETSAIDTARPSTDDLTLDPPVMDQVLPGVSVDLECLAYPDGRIDGCVVIEETRPGLGFGEAAIALMEGATLGDDAARPRFGPVKFRHTIEFTPD
jgi:hypothetical protein